MPRGLARSLSAFSAVLAVLSCEGAQRGDTLELFEFRQNEFATVALNEELLFYFSADLERGSVNSESVRILDDQGHEVAGERLVRGNALSFLPELPRAPDLSDGGLRPGTRYRVLLGGFPRPDGIRSRSGALLSATLLLSFRTAERGGTSPLFLDPFVGPFPLRPRGKYSEHKPIDDGRIVLECAEALDPASVSARQFELRRYGSTGEPETLPLRVRLIVNRRDHAELLLEPASADGLGVARLAPDQYYLGMVERGLQTLGGRTVEPGWPRFLTLVVSSERFDLDLSSTRERSAEFPTGCDGTARWDESGSGVCVWLRYPAAAGSGSAGALELSGEPPASDLHGTRVVVPENAALNLSQRVGPVVIRSQTSLEVRGRLLRRGDSAVEIDPLAEILGRAKELPPGRWETLSDWVERLLTPERDWSRQPWTILIAGGDLRVPKGGAIEVNGPLLLVAGGRIRVEGSVYSQGTLWHTPEASGNIAARGGTLDLPLRLDAPQLNPLKTSLRSGVLTLPLAFGHRSGPWRTILFGREGNGRVSADFLESAPGSQALHLVNDPTQLGNEFRIRIQLEVAPGHGEAWDPPRLERLTLEPVPSTDSRLSSD